MRKGNHTAVQNQSTRKKNSAGRNLEGTVESTLGRFLFNEILPQDLGFVDRTIPGNELSLEVDFHVGKKQSETDP